MSKKRKEYKIGDEFFITGKAMYCFTTRPNNKGKMPTNKYGVTLVDFDSDYNIDNFVTDYVTTDKNGNEVQIERIKIENSKYQIPMFAVDNKRLAEPVAIPNGTSITIYVKVKHSETYDKDYLVCRAIKLNEIIEEFNPFI